MLHAACGMRHAAYERMSVCALEEHKVNSVFTKLFISLVLNELNSFSHHFLFMSSVITVILFQRFSIGLNRKHLPAAYSLYSL